MTVRFECPSCGKRLRAPDAAAGRRMMCSRCDEAVRVPEAKAPADEGPVESEPPDPGLKETLATPEGLGAASLFLGVLSVPVLCVPFLGYASLAASGLGFLLGVAALLRSLSGGGRGGRQPVLTGDLVGVQPRRFPLAGVAVCLVSFVLALLPLVHPG